MNVVSKDKMRIKVSTAHAFAPVIKAIIASLYPVKELTYPWSRWVAYPYGSVEAGNKIIPLEESELPPEERQVLEGIFCTQDDVDIVFHKIHKEVRAHYGFMACTLEVERE